MGYPAEKIEQQEELQPTVAVEVKEDRDTPRLRDFGLVMGTAFTMLSAILLWKGRPTGTLTLGAALLFVTFAYLAPKALAPLEKGWLWFGEKMSVVMTFVIMTLTYFLVMTPIGIFLRIIRKDILDLKLNREAKSYWKTPDVDGPHTRPFQPF